MISQLGTKKALNTSHNTTVHGTKSCLTFLRRLCLKSCLSCWFWSRTVFMLFLSSPTLACSINLSFLVLLSSSCTDSSSTLIFWVRHFILPVNGLKEAEMTETWKHETLCLYCIIRSKLACRAVCRLSSSLWWHCSIISTCCFWASISLCLCSTSHFKSSTWTSSQC